jgi:hypothetical protein
MIKSLKSVLGLAALLLPAGCGPGLPFNQYPDPNAAAAVEETKPLVDDCRGRFATELAGTPAEEQSSPLITRDDEIVSVRLEAQPTGPDAIDPVQFACTYEKGELTLAGRVK